jgi:hypothetical protein
LKIYSKTPKPQNPKTPYKEKNSGIQIKMSYIL